MIGIRIYIQSIEEKSQIIMEKVEIVLNSLPMSGGDGPNSYSKNSHLQVSLSPYFLHILFSSSYFLKKGTSKRCIMNWFVTSDLTNWNRNIEFDRYIR